MVKPCCWSWFKSATIFCSVQYGSYPFAKLHKSLVVVEYQNFVVSQLHRLQNCFSQCILDCKLLSLPSTTSSSREKHISFQSLCLISISTSLWTSVFMGCYLQNNLLVLVGGKTMRLLNGFNLLFLISLECLLALAREGLRC